MILNLQMYSRQLLFCLTPPPKGYWNEICHVHICKTSHVGGIGRERHTCTQSSGQMASAMCRRPRPPSVFPSGWVWPKMSLANRWRLCTFECARDRRGRRHKVRRSETPGRGRKGLGWHDYAWCQCTGFFFVFNKWQRGRTGESKQGQNRLVHRLTFIKTKDFQV